MGDRMCEKARRELVCGRATSRVGARWPVPTSGGGRRALLTELPSPKQVRRSPAPIHGQPSWSAVWDSSPSFLPLVPPSR